VAESMTKIMLKFLEGFNSSIVNPKLHGATHWKATIHIYYLKKNSIFKKSKNLFAFIAACPKTQKVVLATSEF
jgi:hypothetical protein